MKPEEAISAIKNNMPTKGTYTILTEALEVAIQVLENQVARKPCGWNAECFDCMHHLEEYEHPNYCPNCGKKIDWSEE